MESSRPNIKALLVYPKHPETFWSFKHVLKFIGKKATLPPLGLLTVASLLPKEWAKKLIDMNVDVLNDENIQWADYIFISAMVVQKESVGEIIKRCKKFHKKIVAGGPLFTAGYEGSAAIDYFVLGEAEVTLPLFLEDLKKGTLKHIYVSQEKPDLKQTPLPSWDLIDFKKYLSMNIQYSRGCPFDCEFCDITTLFGRVQRTKSAGQVILELEALYDRGWRDGIFFVDDNFIGNKERLKKEILPALIEWRKEKGYPFSFTTEASVNLADDDQLIDLMVEAGFGSVFLGIETPDNDCLAECGKFQNKNRDLVSCIKKIQRKGMQVLGGFIVGFDSDKPSIFERQIKFIQQSGITTAMVGLLTAPRNTKLYYRLLKEKRLLRDTLGNNTVDGSINFIPKMNLKTLVRGYQNIVSTIYSPKCYYQRIINFLENFRPAVRRKVYFHFYYVKSFFRVVWLLGIKEKERLHFWKLIFWALVRRPKSLPLAISFTIQGYHFRKVFEKHI